MEEALRYLVRDATKCLEEESRVLGMPRPCEHGKQIHDVAGSEAEEAASSILRMLYLERV